jgi:hypothetical protein
VNTLNIRERFLLFATGYGTAATFSGMLLLIREWDATTWIAKAIYIALTIYVLFIDWQLLAFFRPCKPSGDEKETPNASPE